MCKIPNDAQRPYHAARHSPNASGSQDGYELFTEPFQGDGGIGDVESTLRKIFKIKFGQPDCLFTDRLDVPIIAFNIASHGHHKLAASHSIKESVSEAHVSWTPHVRWSEN